MLVTAQAITSLEMAQTYYMRDDYYTRLHDEHDRWHGKLAERLGLKGAEVTPDKFNDLLQKNAQRLAPKMRTGEGPRLGLDICCSLSKSVSLAEAESPEMRAIIEECTRATMERTHHMIEDEYLFTRTGKGGKTRVRCDGVMADFNHHLSREEELDRHIHIFLYNMTVNKDGELRTIDTDYIIRHKKEIGARARGIFVKEMRKHGLKPVLSDDPKNRAQGMIELAGYDRETIERYSKRRAQILQEMEENGTRSDIANLKTRKAKNYHADLAAIMQETHDDLQKNGIHAERSERPVDLDPEEARRGRISAYRDALNRLSGQDFSFTADQLRQETLMIGTYYGMTLDEVNRMIAEDKSLLTATHKGSGEQRLTTEAALQREREISRMWFDGAGRFSAATLKPGQAEDLLDQALTKSNAGKPLEEQIHLKPEQRRMILHCLCTDGHTIVNGAAGTGKTFTLNYLRQVAEAAGIEVRGSAFTGKANTGLSAEADIADTSTMDGLLLQAERESLRAQGKPIPQDIDFETKSSYDFAGLKQKTGRPTIMILDEAGMISDAKMHEFQRLAKIKNWKLILTGDYLQYPPIGAGQPMQMLIKQGAATAYLEDIRRQKAKEDAEAAQEFVREHGSVEKAVKHWQSKGYIHEMRKDLIAGQAVKDFLDSPYNVEDRLILTARNVERKAINEDIRKALIQRGELGEGHAFVVDDGRGGKPEARTLHERERVIFLKNDKKLDIQNGAIGTLEKIDGDLLTVNIGSAKKPKRVTININQYKSLDAAYAVTGYKSQGMSIMDVYSINYADDQTHAALYVNSTRYKERLHLYTDDVAKMTKKAGKAINKETMLDYRKFERGNRTENSGYQPPRERAEVRSSMTPPAVRDAGQAERRRLENVLGHRPTIYEGPTAPIEVDGQALQKELQTQLRREEQIALLETPSKHVERVESAQDALDAAQKAMNARPTPANEIRLQAAQERVKMLTDVAVHNRATEIGRYTAKAKEASLEQLERQYTQETQDVPERWTTPEERRSILSREYNSRDPLDLAVHRMPDETALTLEDASSISPAERKELRETIEKATDGRSGAWDEARNEIVLARDRAGGLHVLPFSRSHFRVDGRGRMKAGQKLTFRQLVGFSRAASSQAKDAKDATKALLTQHAQSWRSVGAASMESIGRGAGAVKGGIDKISGAAKEVAGSLAGALNPNKIGKQHIAEAAKTTVGVAIKTPASIVGGIIKNPVIGILSAPVKVAESAPKLVSVAVNLSAGTMKLAFEITSKQDHARDNRPITMGSGRTRTPSEEHEYDGPSLF